ncbi:hypothetical protein GCK72_000132 [Caenorhabditis remanei]|uniref:fumarate hydratase n=1 Tax=Caenorhabditis remanei TaxID=31234 RepID=A0A6A5HJG2_CAERE|nr:hypothetical protein GCK72_000132 [Caenorhabditis remanei]KAF1768320.1 hypothetical protein GCK72_000132 [Caenorhabditis remanei]
MEELQQKYNTLLLKEEYHQQEVDYLLETAKEWETDNANLEKQLVEERSKVRKMEEEHGVVLNLLRKKKDAVYWKEELERMAKGERLSVRKVQTELENEIKLIEQDDEQSILQAVGLIDQIFKTRKERDIFGELEVPADKFYGAGTARLQCQTSFKIGSPEDRMPLPVIHAFGLLKKAAALVNTEFGLDKKLADAISQAADDVVNGKLDDHFPLLVWHASAWDTNVNEVISNRAIENMGGNLGSKTPVHPDAHVNMSQTANATFQSAMHISVSIEIHSRLLPALKKLRAALNSKAEECKDDFKIGRTHTQDAVPLTLGQEFCTYVQQLENLIARVESTLPHLCQLVVGTGLNTSKGFAEKLATTVTELTKLRFVISPIKFKVPAAPDALAEVHKALTTVAEVFLKMGSFLGSGLRCGLGEHSLSEDEPENLNSHREAITIVVSQVLCNQGAVTVGGSNIKFEHDFFKPILARTVLHSTRLLSESADSFTEQCVNGIVANKEKTVTVGESPYMFKFL